MVAVPVRAIAAVAIATAAFACAAQAAPLELTVNPTSVAAGGTVTITGSVTNTNKKAASFVAEYSVTGPCSYSDQYSNSFKLGSQQTRTASVNYTAPGCAGTYTVFATLSGNGTTYSATSSFSVY
jgi:hypothetical protein